MLEILKSLPPNDGRIIEEYKGTSGCFLSDISQLFRINLGDFIPGLIGDTWLYFRYIPGLKIYRVLNNGFPELISDMLSGILKELDNSKILEDPEEAEKAINQMYTFKEVDAPIKNVFDEEITRKVKIDTQYFNLKSRFKENPKWTGVHETYLKGPWNGQDLYIRIRRDSGKGVMELTFQSGVSDIQTLENLIKYKYVFRRFITKTNGN